MSDIGQRYVQCPVCKGAGGDWSSTQDGREYCECPGCNDWLTVSRRHVAGLIRAYWLDKGTRALETRSHRAIHDCHAENARPGVRFGEPYLLRRFAKGAQARRLTAASAHPRAVEYRRQRAHDARYKRFAAKHSFTTVTLTELENEEVSNG